MDDEEVICKTLEMMVHRIKSLGEIKTFLASDAYTALQILGEEKINVILTDLCMDEMGRSDLYSVRNGGRKSTGYYRRKCLRKF